MLRPSIFFLLNWLFLLSADFLLSVTFPLFFPVEHGVYAYLAGVLAVISIGGYFSNVVPRVKLPRIILIRYNLMPKLHSARFWMFALFMIALTTGAERYLMQGIGWFSPAGINDYRNSVTEMGEVRLFPILSLFNFFIFFAGAYFVYFRLRTTFAQRVIISVLILFLLYISSARSTAFFFVLITVFTFVLRNGFRKWIFITPFLLALLFFAIGKISGKDDPLSLISYYFAPFHAFAELFVNPALFQADYDFLSFRFLQGALSQMGLVSDPVTMLPYVETPLLTNVYTVFYVYWYDLGYLSLIFWFIFGFSADSLYRWHCVRQDFLSTSLMAMLLASIVLSVFYDYFTSSAFIYTSFIILILFSSANKKSELT